MYVRLSALSLDAFEMQYALTFLDLMSGNKPDAMPILLNINVLRAGSLWTSSDTSTHGKWHSSPSYSIALEPEV